MKLTKMLTLQGLPALLLLSPSEAVTLVSDDFSYPDGSLTANPAWDTHSGSEGDLLVSGGAAIVQHGAPSEDANLTFGTQSAGVLTATFDLTVSDDETIGLSGSDFEYFAHFFTEGSFNFRSRVDVQAPTGGGDYTLGISSSTSTGEATLATDFAFGDTIPVSIDFDFADGTASLTAGGETVFGSADGAGQSLDSFALRQSDSSNNETVTVDNLVISSTIPEPSTTLLGGLALLGLLRRRR